MIVVSEITKAFGETAVLSGVSFEIPPGQLVGLVGPGGGGKSVLLKIIGDVLASDSGEVSLGADYDVGFLFQSGALFDSLSVLDNVAFPLSAHNQGASNQERQQRAFDALVAVGLARHYTKLPGQLSGGMRRRVALARAIVARAKVLLLDDPTSGLDPVSANVIIDLIEQLHVAYRPSIIMVSHDLRRLLPRVERVLCLFAGKIVCDSAPGELTQHASAEVLNFLSTRYDFPVEAPSVSDVGGG